MQSNSSDIPSAEVSLNRSLGVLQIDQIRFAPNLKQCPPQSYMSVNYPRHMLKDAFIQDHIFTYTVFRCLNAEARLRQYQHEARQIPVCAKHIQTSRNCESIDSKPCTSYVGILSKL